MDKTLTLNLRINPTVKEKAENVLKQLGIPMSTAVDMYLRQIALKGGIPFPLTTSSAPQELDISAMTNKQLYQAIHEGLDDLDNGQVSDAHEAFQLFREAHQ